MTQLRKRYCPQCGYDLDPISNWFDRILGRGHRGSSFTNIDAATHDGATDRWLIQEFKAPEESPLSNGQLRHLRALAQQPAFTVWCVRKLDEESVRWWDLRSAVSETIAIEEYRARWDRWWNRDVIAVRVTIADWFDLPDE